MNIYRHGYESNHGLNHLADDEIRVGRSRSFRHPVPDDGIALSRDRSKIEFWVKGLDAKKQGDCTYGYVLSITGEELALIVERAVGSATTDESIKAHASAMAAFIRSIIKPIKDA